MKRTIVLLILCAFVTASDETSSVEEQEAAKGEIDCELIITNISFPWRDPQFGGIGGYNHFGCQGTKGVDRVHITSDDGLELYVPGGGETTEYTLETETDGYPRPDHDPTYTVIYEVESPPGSGIFIGGTPCILEREWEDAFAHMYFTTDPMPGGSTSLTVEIYNGRWDGTRLAHLGGPQGLSVDLVTPTYVDQEQVVFEDVLVFDNLSHVHQGTYVVSVLGAGPEPNGFDYEIELDLGIDVPVLGENMLIVFLLVLLGSGLIMMRRSSHDRIR